MTEQLFNKINFVKGFCQWVLPLAYDDSLSYLEQLCKIKKAVNDLIENNNNLPAYIMEMIKSYITSGEIDKVIRDILANYILNVKYPPNGLTPAVGDGTADDSEAIQGCIDYAYNNGGGAVYFPSGSYLCHDLELKDNVSVFGFDRYNTRLICKGGASAYVLGGNASNLSICNLNISGNGGYQVNHIDGINLTGSNYLLNNIIVRDSYRNIMLTTTTGHVQMSNVVTYSFLDQSISVDGDAQVQALGIICNETLSNQATGVVYIGTNYGLWDLSIYASVEPSILASGQGNDITLYTTSTEAIVPENTDNNYHIRGKAVRWNLSELARLTLGSVLVNINGDTNLNLNELTLSASQSTEDVSGNKETTIQGNYNVTADSLNIKAGDSDIQTNTLTVNNAGNLDITTSTQSLTSKSSTENITEVKNITANKTVVQGSDFEIKTTNPLTYKSPTPGSYFDTIPAKDYNGNSYNILVENGSTAGSLTPKKNYFDFNFKQLFRTLTVRYHSNLAPTTDNEFGNMQGGYATDTYIIQVYGHNTLQQSQIVIYNHSGQIINSKVINYPSSGNLAIQDNVLYYAMGELNGERAYKVLKLSLPQLDILGSFDILGSIRRICFYNDRIVSINEDNYKEFIIFNEDNTSFTTLFTIQNDFYALYPPSAQTLYCDGTYFYLLASGPNILYIIDVNGNIIQTYEFPTLINNQFYVTEVEWFCMNNGVPYLGYRTNLTQLWYNAICTMDNTAFNKSTLSNYPAGGQTLYVDMDNQSLTPDGTVANPFQEISEALYHSYNWRGTVNINVVPYADKWYKKIILMNNMANYIIRNNGTGKFNVNGIICCGALRLINAVVNNFNPERNVLVANNTTIILENTDFQLSTLAQPTTQIINTLIYFSNFNNQMGAAFINPNGVLAIWTRGTQFELSTVFTTIPPSIGFTS